MRKLETIQMSTAYENCKEAIRSGIESNNLKLPVMPKVAGEILLLTNNPNAQVSEFSNLIHQDQALAGYVLKVANSSAYGGSGHIVSLQQALARLGMKLLGDIAIAITLQDDTFKTPGYEGISKELMKHALAAGAYSKEIARMLRQNVEGQFLCGMLHGIGKPVVLKLCIQSMQSENLDFEMGDVERLIEEFHVSISDLVTQSWELPQVIQVTSAYYQKYKEAPSFQKETMITYLSSQLATWILNPEKLSEEALRSDPVLQELNFYPDDVDQLLAKKEAVLSVVGSLHI